ncbi:MAG: hypothetical protein M3449_11235 [Acidobacteriota bacterium]|nr:hypothetical protein [Blastocatellia bacterium]MDQ3221462.1 hypothetical protein [Acidobacteriota bacterium]MDQ3491619.1 hypothetical protein [Acidobacteriota bacterium]
MKANKYISKKEHISLVIFSFAVFSFVFTINTLEVARFYNYSVSEKQEKLQSQADGTPHIQFSGSSGPHLPAGLHFLTFFIFISLFGTKRYLVSSLLTLFYAIVFIYGLYARYAPWGEEFSPKVDFLEKLYRVADTFDYLAAVFISILLFWQISILLRIFIKILQRKKQLP